MMKQQRCKIKGVTSDFSRSRSLVNFDHGCLSKKEAEEFDCSILSDRKNDLLAVVGNSRQNYVGQFDSDPLCQTLLLIKNKTKRKARLVSIPTCVMSLPHQEKEKASNKNLNMSSQDYDKRRSDLFELTRVFGSKRSKRQSEIHVRMNANTTSNNAELTEAISGIVVENDSIDLNDQLQIMSVVPTCNRKAVLRNEVYNIDNILTETERNSCNVVAQNLIDNPPEPTDENHSLFLRLFFKKLSRPNSLEAVTLLIYADVLLKFMIDPIREIKKKGYINGLCPFSNIVGSRILKDFTVGFENNRGRPNSMKDKVACYVMVIILLICDFLVDMNLLAPFLKGMNQKRYKQLARTVGLVPMSLGSQRYTLKLPLPPLPTGYGPKKK